MNSFIALGVILTLYGCDGGIPVIDIGEYHYCTTVVFCDEKVFSTVISSGCADDLDHAIYLVDKDARELTAAPCESPDVEVQCESLGGTCIFYE